MEKKQGFFSALKEEVVRGLSPARSRARSPSRSASPMTGLLRRRSRKSSAQQMLVQNFPEPLISRSGSLRPAGEALAPLMEGPLDPASGDGDCRKERWGHWMKGQFSRAPSISSSAVPSSYRRSDLRLLLGVMGAPLAPIHVCSADPLPHLSIKDTPIETSSAHYILQQYTAASGGQKLQSSIRNAYAMGKVKMLASEFETATKVMKNRNSARAAESGGFVLWQMNPDMWYVELAVGGSKGLDPRTTASMFANARCIGEKKVNGEDCFILKLCADPLTLKARSEGPAEIIRHVLFGYFSQRTGLLTTINSFLDDYRPVEGIMIAHSGRSVVTLFRFGEMAMSHTKTRMEEAWTIEEVAFNVPGLSMDCFIPLQISAADRSARPASFPMGRGEGRWFGPAPSEGRRTR
ncbi:unnamed protein product [Spirodela intermedia]|uniref:Uncharacterized protein n=1 Tax=Spirodela intermedia TaxID=51605 RepID=A0A7I8IKG8_SPIIN|nr:unnamed protein product [Spirodela intermedia]CAA6657487.1 unnamed protein product [Spirodela intermedia]